MHQQGGLRYTAQSSFVAGFDGKVPRFDVGSNFITIYWNDANLRDRFNVNQVKQYFSTSDIFDAKLVMFHGDDDHRAFFHGDEAERRSAHYHFQLNNEEQYDDFIISFLEEAREPLAISDEDEANLLAMLGADRSVEADHSVQADRSSEEDQQIYSFGCCRII